MEISGAQIPLNSVKLRIWQKLSEICGHLWNGSLRMCFNVSWHNFVNMASPQFDYHSKSRLEIVSWELVSKPQYVPPRPDW